MAIPRFAWGDDFANICDFRDPPDAPLATVAPVGQRRFARAYTGAGTAAWQYGVDCIVTLDMGRIPLTATDGATGYDGPTGVKMMTAWMQRGKPFRFWPDRDDPAIWYTCVLLEPTGGPPQVEPNGTKRIRYVFRTADGAYVQGY